MDKYEEYKKQRIKEIQEIFHCSEEKAIGVFHELPDNDFSKWEDKQKLDSNELSKILDSLNFDELFKEISSIPITPLIASLAIRKSIVFLKDTLKESEDK